MDTSTGTKVRILIFTPTLECGGSENYVSLLCNHIGSDKFEITLVVINNAHPFYNISNKEVEIVELGIKHVRHSLFAIKNIVKEKSPDIIFTTANHLNLLFATFRWMFPKKMLIIARESSIVSINSKGSKFPEFYNKLIHKFYKRLDLILCQSVYMQQDLVSNFNIDKNKTIVINNPVREIMLQEIKPSLNQEEEKNIKFITVARLSKEKGIDRLIRSVAHLSIPFQYHIIGEGNQRTALQVLINSLHLQQKVFLMGEKVHPFQHREDASLFLQGSYFEGFPNVLVEAGSLGIPVIAFEVPGGTGEIITDGENGLIVGENDETAFTAAIEKALTMNFNRNKIIATTKKRYAIDLIIPQVEELFLRQLMSKTE